jgi:hypothetical protein
MSLFLNNHYATTFSEDLLVENRTLQCATPRASIFNTQRNSDVCTSILTSLNQKTLVKKALLVLNVK